MGRRIGKYRLEVTYDLGADLDEKVTKAVRKRDWASGAGFGERDLNFDFRSQSELDAAE